MKAHLIHQLKIIVGILLLACALRSELPAQSKNSRIKEELIPLKTELMMITLDGGVSGKWLQIGRHNHPGDPKGFDPSFVSIVCDFKPVVTKRANGTFEITFISDLPNPPP